jgi:hypothetical protein
MAKGLEQAAAKAHATAAQIWAEMLGLVCHPEYYKLGDQTVIVTSARRILIVGFCGTFQWIPRLRLLRYLSSRISLYNSTRGHPRVEI